MTPSNRPPAHARARRTSPLRIAVAVLAAAVTGTLLVVAAITAANATTNTPDIGQYCTPVYAEQPNPDHKPATWQHYSWTGGPSPQAPAFPGAKWQPNGKKHKDEPAGAYKQGGPASWFYWEHTPAVGDPTITVQAGETCDLWVTWAAPGWFPAATNASSIGWPQQLVGLGKIQPEACETTYQQDHYVGARAAIEGILADGVLTGPNPPEDHAVVKAWEIVSTDACPEPEPSPDPSPSPDPDPEPEPEPTPTPTPDPEPEPEPTPDPEPTPECTGYEVFNPIAGQCQRATFTG